MTVQLAVASKDENDNFSGGEAGDQNGKEVKIRNWYSHPWIKVMRPNDSAIGKKIADIATAGANNDNIGYNQAKRNTLRTQAQKVNFDLSKITTPCDTDCSAFVAVCCEGAGLTVVYSYGNAPTTGTIAYTVSDCTLLTDSKYLTSSDYLKKGDILLANGHVAICIDNGTQVQENVSCDVYNVQKIWDYLLNKIGNEYGVAGLMGNLQAESGLYSDRLQGDIPRSNESIKYTKKVTNGTISMYDFVHNAPNGGGYGLAQWTYFSRKQKLYNLWRSNYNGHSIGCLDLALEFLWYELQNSYGSVLSVLKNADSVRVASDSVLHNFENPADQSTSVEEARCSLGQTIYDRYSNGQAPDNPTEGTEGESGSGDSGSGDSGSGDSGSGDSGSGGGSGDSGSGGSSSGDSGSGDSGSGGGSGDSGSGGSSSGGIGSGHENSGGTDTDYANFDWSILGIDIDNLNIDDFVDNWDIPHIDIEWLDWDSITLVGYDEKFAPVYSLYDMIAETSFIMPKIKEEQKNVLKAIELEDKINMKYTQNHNKKQVGYDFTGGRLTFTTFLYIIKKVENNGFIRINTNKETTYNYMQPNFIMLNDVYMEEKYRRLQNKLDEKISGLKSYLLDELEPLFDEKLEEIENEKLQGGITT